MKTNQQILAHIQVLYLILINRKRMKAKECDFCQYFVYNHEPNATRPKCNKGHKPRFYAPKNERCYGDGWGFKRRCTDFKEGRP